jgi:NADH dehydrogenase
VNVFDEFKPDTVVHLAAVTHTARVSEYERVNTHGTQNLISTAQKYNCKRFIFLSSRAAELGGGAYAESKLKAEEAIRVSGLTYTILRPAEVYGGSPKEALTVLSQWIRTYHIAPLVGNGTASVAPVWITDVIDATVEACENDVAIGKTFTLAGPEVMTMQALAKRIGRYYGVRVLLIPIPIMLLHGVAVLQNLLGLRAFAQDQIDRLLVPKDSDSSIATRDLHFNPVILEEGLAKLARRI